MNARILWRKELGGYTETSLRLTSRLTNSQVVPDCITFLLVLTYYLGSTYICRETPSMNDPAPDLEAPPTFSNLISSIHPFVRALPVISSSTFHNVVIRTAPSRRPLAPTRNIGSRRLEALRYSCNCACSRYTAPPTIGNRISGIKSENC